MLFTKGSSFDFPWKLLIVEAILVVLSVLLALALNSWREASAHQNQAERALQEVLNEVETNCSQIQNYHTYHEAVANGEQEPAGIQSGMLRNDAWDVAKTTGGASYLDHELVAKVGEISAHQSDHRSIVQAYLQALFTIGLQLEQPEKMHREGERGVIRELVGIQETLLKRYQELLDLVNEHYGDSFDTSDICKEGE